MKRTGLPNLRKCATNINILILWLLLFTLVLSKATFADQVLIASGHPDYPPAEWQDGDKIIGLAMELTALIFNDLGIKVVSTVSGNWKRVQNMAREGKIDVIVAAYINDERKTYLEYPKTPFMEDPNVIWVKKGKSFPFEKWEDLIGKTGCTTIGESFGQQFDMFAQKHLNLIHVSTFLQVLKMVESDRADFIPTGLYTGKFQMVRYGYMDQVEYLPRPFLTEGLYITISKKSKFSHLIGALDQGIQKYKNDGTVSRLLNKYVDYYIQSIKEPNGRR